MTKNPLTLRIMLYLCMAVMPLAAGTTGKIVGAATDARTGEPLIGCNILIEGSSMGAATDLNGEYTILNVPPGTHTLRASMIGYGARTVTDVSVSIDLTTTVDFVLTTEVLGGQEVVVTAVKRTVKLDQTSQTAVISADDISNLPVAEINDVIELQTGIVRSGNDIHVRGGRAGEVAYWVDGISALDVYDGSFGLEVENNAVQEMQIISGTFNAEYGQAMSGLINIVTKDGGNEFHGGADIYIGGYQTNDGRVYNLSDLHRETDTGVDIDNSGDLDSTTTYWQRRPEGYTPRLNVFNYPTQLISKQIYLSGPILTDRLTFYLTAREYETENHKYGRQLLDPYGETAWDYLITLDQPVMGTVIDAQGDTIPFNVPSGTRIILDSERRPDGEIIALNPYSKRTAQLKLTYRPLARMKFNYGIYYDDKFWREDSWNRKYSPIGRNSNYDQSLSQILNFTHTLSSRTFYELRYTHFSKDFRQRLTTDIDDSFIETAEIVTPDSTFTIDLSSFAYVESEDPSLGSLAPYSFDRGGTDMGRFQRNTSYDVVKFDITSQVNRNNEIKAGAEYRQHLLTYHDRSVVPLTVGEINILGYNSVGGSRYYPFIPTYYPRRTLSNDYYRRKPREISGYFQDKIEMQDIVVNVGIRFDYFEANGYFPVDRRDPANERYFLVNTGEDTVLMRDYYDDLFVDFGDGPVLVPRDSSLFSSDAALVDLIDPILAVVDVNGDPWRYNYEKAKPKTQISPRIGISYPITDRGAIHVSYGHFFQIPNFQYLFQNAEYEIQRGNNELVGNPDLGAQRTVQYEVGLKQEVAPYTALDVTAFYRDIRDLVSSGGEKYSLYLGFGKGTNYSIYRNSAYGNTRGFTLSLRRSSVGGWGYSADYSFMVSEATYATTDAAFQATQDNKAPRLTLIPNPWDQRHTLNASANYTRQNLLKRGDFITSALIFQSWSGTPYTPSFSEGSVSGTGAFSGLPENSGRKPWQFNVDLRLAYGFSIAKAGVKLYLNIYNLFDTRNETDVHGETGRATYSTNVNRYLAYNPVRVGEPTEQVVTPYRFSEPRKINLGLSFDF